MTTKTRPVTHQLEKSSATCRRLCPHGQPCGCRGDVHHVLHICKYPGCACHSRERYEAAVTEESTT